MHCILQVMSDEAAGNVLQFPLVGFNVFNSANLSTKVITCTQQQQLQLDDESENPNNDCHGFP